MGRHGGINILHQKSWHVWRMDNRLRVERDELQHATAERERLAAEHQATFSGRVALLRRRASGGGEEVLPLGSLEGPVSASSVVLLSEAASRRSTGGDVVQSTKAPEVKDSDNSYRHGAVTLCNLKQAERDLDQALKRRHLGMVPHASESGKAYWGIGTGGLGSGSHINLFEDAELAVDNQRTQHDKLLQYAERNNELVEKSKRRPLSEFDEVVNTVPWYARSREQSLPVAEAIGSVGGVRRQWTSRHGQSLLYVEPARSSAGELAAALVAPEAPLALADRGVANVCEIKSSCSDSSPESSTGRKTLKRARKHKHAKDKGSKMKKDKKRKESNEERTARRRAELAELRQQREQREREERSRAARAVAAGR